MKLIAIGGLANFLAIVANGGVMPASASALRTAGLAADPAGYTNSGLVEHAHLAFLGDVFALPASWPAANVFSVGDLLLAAGAFVLLHAVCGSRLGAAAARPASPRSSGEHDGLVAVDEHAVLEMPAHGAREHEALDVGAPCASARRRPRDGRRARRPAR